MNTATERATHGAGLSVLEDSYESERLDPVAMMELMGDGKDK